MLASLEAMVVEQAQGRAIVPNKHALLVHEGIRSKLAYEAGGIAPTLPSVHELIMSYARGIAQPVRMISEYGVVVGTWLPAGRNDIFID
jgi:hypothetical protein